MSILVKYQSHLIFLPELCRGLTGFFVTIAPRLMATLSPSLPKYGIVAVMILTICKNPELYVVPTCLAWHILSETTLPSKL